jgi:hypothetical protein
MPMTNPNSTITPPSPPSASASPEICAFAPSGAVRLEDGDLLVMDAPTQHHWQHALPPRTRVVAERINLTFRVIR